MTPAAATSTTIGWWRASSTFAAPPSAPVDQLLLSRQSLSPLYGQMLNWGPYGRGPGAWSGTRHRPREHRLRHHHGQLRAAVRASTHGLRRPRRRGRARRTPPRALRVRHRAACDDPDAHGPGGVALPGAGPTGGAGRGRARRGPGRHLVRDSARTAARPRRVPDRARRGSPAAGALGLAGGDRAARRGGRRAAAGHGASGARSGPALALSDLALGIGGRERPLGARRPPTRCCSRRSSLFLERSQVELYYEAQRRGARRRCTRIEIAVYRMKGDGRRDERPVVDPRIRRAGRRRE